MLKRKVKKVYDEETQELTAEMIQARNEGDWKRYDEMRERRSKNLADKQKEKDINAKLDRSNWGVIIGKIVGGLSVVGSIAVAFYFEGLKGKSLSGEGKNVLSKFYSFFGKD